MQTHEITPSHNHSALRYQYAFSVPVISQTDLFSLSVRIRNNYTPPPGGEGGGESVLSTFLSRAHLGQARSKRQSSCDLLCSDAHDAVPW